MILAQLARSELLVELNEALPCLRVVGLVLCGREVYGLRLSILVLFVECES